MRRTIFAIGILLSLLVLSACDLGNPATIKSKVEEAMRPYFPNTQAVIRPQESMIIALSCIQGEGPQMVSSVAQMLAANSGMNQLKSLRTMSRVVGGTTYRFFELGFQNSMIVYDLDTGRISTVPNTNPDYSRAYRQVCNLDNAGPPASTAAFAYIGIWDVDYADQNGVVKRTRWYDTLGVYNNDQRAQQYQDSEVQTRIAMIAAAMEQRGGKLVNAQLLQVKAAPLTRDLLTVP